MEAAAQSVSASVADCPAQQLLTFAQFDSIFSIQLSTEAAAVTAAAATGYLTASQLLHFSPRCPPASVLRPFDLLF